MCTTEGSGLTAEKESSDGQEYKVFEANNEVI
jgi:hypothetical protein